MPSHKTLIRGYHRSLYERYVKAKQKHMEFVENIEILGGKDSSHFKGHINRAKRLSGMCWHLVEKYHDYFY